MSQSSSQVLVVEDDPLGLNFFRSSLTLSGYQVATAQSASEAEKILEEEGLDAFNAVLTDFRMPGRTGLDLLAWIRDRDASLATIIVTAQGERELVKRSLSAGAAGFLDKPVKHQQLATAIEQAIEQTRRQRQLADDQASLEAAAEVDTLFSAKVPRELEPHLHIYYHPLHQIGGDFVFARALQEGRFLLVAGDVSGHDVPSALISVYFQGMLQGLAATAHAPWQALPLIHDHLCERTREQTASDELAISLAVAMVEIDLKAPSLGIFSGGFPHLLSVNPHGFVRPLGTNNSPLGWDHDVDFSPNPYDASALESFILFSDGVLEMADELGISPLSIVFAALQRGKKLSDHSLQTDDDILILNFMMQAGKPLSDSFQPLIDEHYSGDEVDNIDQLQNLWRRSLQFAVDDELGDRLYDFLICLREGMINAMVHGCERSASKVARLQVAYSGQEKTLRVRIDDPGKGHDFNLQARLDAFPEGEGRKMGLGLIQHLANDFAIENEGTSLLFDFEVSPEAPQNG